MTDIEIYRGANVNEKLKISERITYTHSLMSDHKIMFDGHRTPRILDLQIGDYMLYKGVKYTINTIPNYSKVEHTTDHEYNITFEAPIYKLYDKSFRYEAQSEFPFFGTLDDFATHLLSQINEIDPGWTKGEIAETPEQHINFDGVSCRVALTQGAEAYGAEFYFNEDGRRLNMVIRVGIDRDITLQHGKGNGLYNLSRTYVQEKNVVTRVFGTGGTRNLPVGYSYSRLQLPAPIEANIDLYGIKEGEYRNEDIIPTRMGVVSSVVEYDPETRFNNLTDTSLDFDINAQLAPGLTPHIHFVDGELAGYEFEITNYDHATKTITYLTNTDTSNGFVMPNENFSAKAGDKYKLFDIVMPQSYVDDAISLLQAETQSYLDENKFPNVAYDLNIDVLHFKRKGYELNPGDRIRVVDADINLDEMIRVTSVSYPLAFPDHLWTGMQYTAEIASNFIPYTVQERIIIEQKEQKKQIKDQSKLSKHTQAALEEIARAAAIQQFERTYIGELAILTGALLVGNPSLGAVAGVSGLEDVLSAIRFFAGSDFGNRDTAPFRVDQEGNLWATKATIEGVIKALSGMIGGWNITTSGLVNSEDYHANPEDPDDTNPVHDAYIICRRYFRDALGEVLGLAAAKIGANILPSATGLRAVAEFTNTEPATGGNTNYGVLVDVANGFRNIGIRSNAPIVSQGWNGSWNQNYFTPSSGSNVLNPRYGSDFMVFIPSAALEDVYFPTDEYINAAFAITSADNFSIVISVTNRYDSAEAMQLRVPAGWTIKDRIGGSIVDAGAFVIRSAESVTVMMVRAGSVKYIQRLGGRFV